MPCVAFEDRLLDYEAREAAERGAVDVHLVDCEDCRIFLANLTAVDRELEQAFAAVAPRPQFSEAVLKRARLPRVSAIPELLDGFGALAVMAVLCWAVIVVPALSRPWLFTTWTRYLPLLNFR